MYFVPRKVGANMLEWGGDGVMTIEEVAAFLKVSETTAYQLVRSGEIQGRKVGREWRFLKSEIVQWLKKGGESSSSSVLQDDLNGGEYKVENGQEMVALWLPLSREEKAKTLKTAQAKKTSVTEAVMNFLKDWF
jgi:excisionase family DNA binding protein